MSIREQFPGDRGGGATQDVTPLLAAIALPPIEPFGTDSEVLDGLPEYTPFPVPTPEPPSRTSVAMGVHERGIAALEQLRRLEDSVQACKVRLVAQVCGAAEVQMVAAKLDSWQRSVSGASTATELALALHIPERTAASLEYHAIEIVSSHPLVLAGMDAGDFSYRHAVTMIDECDTLRSTAGITTQDLAVFQEKLLRLVQNTTVASFAGKARRARERMHPESMVTRTKEAFTKRKISCDAGADGMSWLTLYLPTVSATAIYTRCTRLARAIKRDAAAAHRAAQNSGASAQAGDDPREHRTLDQLRTDIATLLLLGQDLPTANTRPGPTGSTATHTGAGPRSGSDNDTGAGPDITHTAGDSSAARAGERAGAAAGTTDRSGLTAEGLTAEGTSWWDSLSEADEADDDEEPIWAHPVPRSNCPTDDTVTGAGQDGAETTTAGRTDNHEIHDSGNISDSGSSNAAAPAAAAPSGGTAPPPHGQDTSNDPAMQQGAATAGADGLLPGRLPGDGSGYVEGIVDGIVEHSMEEYLEQLDLLSRSRVMIDPPLPQALILVTVPLLGLLGITDEPAELAGPDGGPMSEDVARKLLANSTSFLRLLTDPISGEALPLKPERYQPTAPEKAALQALAGGCYVPNCSNPVMDTELDHLRAFEFGGQSTFDNLKPSCKRHHHMRHLKDDKDRNGQRRCINEPERNSIQVRGWTPKTTQDGRVGWITPTGSYQPPQNTDPPRPKYPKWLKKLIVKTSRKQSN